MAGAHVVLVEDDDTGENGVSVTRVLVNGTDLGRVLDDVKIRVGSDGRPTTIRLTLVPSRLEIRGELADGDRREPRAGFTAALDAPTPGG
ncbi:hypothetical protein [Streptomyces sp. NPDC048603]|uniref:hypothetical protein n=1 Tax=Streptomyces sp. NPDC048603 TaxID=3365577 RepID=UPI003722E307